MSIDIDKYVDEAVTELNSAGEQDEQLAAKTALGGDTPAAAPKEKGALDKANEFDADVRRWTQRLPRNIGIGLLDAAVSTWDAFKGAAIASGQGAEMRESADSGAVPVAKPASDVRMESAGIDKALDDGETLTAIRAFRNHAAQGDALSDSVTQGAAQFMIPFMGFSKALGGYKAVSKATAIARGLGAEAATVATAFDPEAGRVADLYALGQHTEGKLADALNAAAPDGSLLNSYISYMSDRDNEGAAEGRFKNVVDSLVSSVAVAGLFKAGAVYAKGTRHWLENMVPSKDGKGVRNQEGMVAFHGTPHDFDAFDLSKIGTGEGAQVYGHGLYFAEAEGTAKHYRGALSRRGVTPGSAMENAMTAMENANYDAKEAYTTLMNKAAKTTDSEWRETLTNAANKIKAGNVKQLGKLMTVDIPDEVVAKMIDYDKALSEQPHVLSKIPAKVRSQLEEMLDEAGYSPDLDAVTGNQLQQMIGRAISEDRIVFNPADGNFDNTKKLAAEYFNSLGIPGIRYLDQKSRGAKGDTSNIVLFDDKLVTITKKD